MSDESQGAVDALAAMFERSEDLERAALAAYETRREAVRAAAVLEYRCASRGCHLLTVWRTPVGLMFYQPPYKLAPAVNEATSNADGRAANTSDGDRRWNARGGRLDDLRAWDEAGLRLNCDHVHKFVGVAELFAAADSGVRGSPVRRNVG